MIFIKSQLFREVDSNEKIPHLILKLIIQTLSYSDFFDFPLTKKELYRFFQSKSITYNEISIVLKNSVNSSRISCKDGFYFLNGKSNLVELRKLKHESSQILWKNAIKFGAIIARIPFVRMICITGSLALNNSSKDDDIDYLIVTKANYLWVCRFLVMILVIASRLRSVKLCPNYFVTEDNLQIFPQNLYTARELIQMKPIYGYEIYLKMINFNSWILKYLPNAKPYKNFQLITENHQTKNFFEYLLSNPLVRCFDKIEMKRIQNKYENEITNSEVVFTQKCCKGHFDKHGKKIQRLIRSKIDVKSADNNLTFYYKNNNGV